MIIIAEAGLNHGGRLDDALMLAVAAKAAGADVVKFQMFRPGSVIPSLHHLALRDAEMVHVAKECERLEIEFCATPEDLDSLRFLIEECGIRRIKLGSGSMLYRPLVDSAFFSGLPVLMSTGMATMREIIKAMLGAPSSTTIMHCVSLYPCPDAQANVGALYEMRGLRFPLGYSDHTLGTVSAIVAVGLGAQVIEKHLKLPDTSPADDAVSLETPDFFDFVRSVRNAVVAYGRNVKDPGEDERKMIPLIRKDAFGRQPGVP